MLVRVVFKLLIDLNPLRNDVQGEKMRIRIVCFLWVALATVAAAKAQNFTILTVFDGGLNGAPQPGMPPLARDAAGNLYGASPTGGGGQCFFSSGCGTIYKVDPTGKVTTLKKH